MEQTQVSDHSTVMNDTNNTNDTNKANDTNSVEVANTANDLNKANDTNDVKEMVIAAYQALDSKKAEDIRIIDIQGVTVIADYFIIANGSNQNQLEAMKDAVDEALYRSGYHLKQLEGNRNSSWILMDYGDVIVHLFSKEDRLFYDLEKIWTDGKTVEIEDI